MTEGGGIADDNVCISIGLPRENIGAYKLMVVRLEIVEAKILLCIIEGTL